MKCPEDAVGEEIKNAVEKDQEIIVSVTTNKTRKPSLFALSGDCIGGLQ